MFAQWEMCWEGGSFIPHAFVTIKNYDGIWTVVVVLFFAVLSKSVFVAHVLCHSVLK